MIILIDNYDSFSYNLVHYLETLGADVRVFRNDGITPEELLKLKPSTIVVSPGPSSPENAGISVELIKAAAGKVPVFGVCLGMQSIAHAFGGRIVRAKRIMHGKISAVSHFGKYAFKGLASPISAVRYHSLAVERESLPECFEITAEADDGEIMGIRHRRFKIEGVQFHPESIMTSCGKRILENFLIEAESSGGGLK